jgi:hypothetical protein
MRRRQSFKLMPRAGLCFDTSKASSDDLDIPRL